MKATYARFTGQVNLGAWLWSLWKIGISYLKLWARLGWTFFINFTTTILKEHYLFSKKLTVKVVISQLLKDIRNWCRNKDAKHKVRNQTWLRGAGSRACSLSQQIPQGRHKECWLPVLGSAWEGVRVSQLTWAKKLTEASWFVKKLTWETDSRLKFLFS